MRRALGDDPGCVCRRLNPQPVLADQHRRRAAASSGATATCSAASTRRSLRRGRQVRRRSCGSYDGFAAPPRSDLFRNTPNIDIDIHRERASLYGVSTARIESLLRARLLAELRLPDQAAGRPVPGHPRSRRHATAPIPRTCASSTSSRDDGNKLVPRPRRREVQARSSGRSRSTT